TERSTEVMAARWTMPVVPGVTAASRTAASRRSPLTKVTRSERTESGGSCRSTTVTGTPRSTNARTTDRPTKPEPPVTTTRAVSAVGDSTLLGTGQTLTGTPEAQTRTQSGPAVA